MLKNSKYIIILIVCIAFFSCKTSKNLENAHEKSATTNIVSCTMNTMPQFTSFEGKASLSAKFDGKSYNIKASIRILTDSCISISIQPIAGIEMLRIHATKEKLVVLNRIESEYYEATYNAINKLTGLFTNYETLQSILSNHLFLASIDSKKLNNSMFEVSSFPDGYELMSSNQLSDCPYIFDYLIDKNCRIYQNTIASKENTDAFSCKYSNFMQIGKYQFPYNIELSTFDGKKTERMSITFSKIEINKSLNMTLNIPAKYQKTDISLLDELF